jgi:RsiW-degrading membrane proteinase PrsW (M82 family)
MSIFANSPKTLILAFVGGIIPSLLWLWFWLKEEESPEPGMLLSVIFVIGMAGVIVALSIERFIQTHIASPDGQLVLWASAEEVVKYLAVLILLYKTNKASKPIDWPIYMVTAALGFAALENALFLIKPLGATAGLFGAASLGQLRFLGSTLLHTVSSGVVGIAMGISLYMKGFKKFMHVFIALVIAIALHSAFNFFIIRNDGNDFLKVFGFLWVATIIVMLLFEKVRRMSEVNN